VWPLATHVLAFEGGTLARSRDPLPSQGRAEHGTGARCGGPVRRLRLASYEAARPRAWRDASRGASRGASSVLPSCVAIAPPVRTLFSVPITRRLFVLRAHRSLTLHLQLPATAAVRLGLASFFAVVVASLVSHREQATSTASGQLPQPPASAVLPLAPLSAAASYASEQTFTVPESDASVSPCALSEARFYAPVEWVRDERRVVPSLPAPPQEHRAFAGLHMCTAHLETRL